MHNKQSATATAMLAVALLTVPAHASADHGYDMWDLDGVPDQDPSVADWTGPSGERDGIRDTNHFTWEGSSYQIFDVNQDDHPDGYGYDWSGPENKPDGIFDYWIFETPDGQQRIYEPSQYPAPTQDISQPRAGEVWMRPNPKGGTDLIFGGVAELPPGWEVESWARSNPCYEYTWILPDNIGCRPQ